MPVVRMRMNEWLIMPMVMFVAVMLVNMTVVSRGLLGIQVKRLGHHD